MDDRLDAAARLEARLENLERRVAALERPAKPAAPHAMSGATSAPAAQANQELALPPSGGLFPVVGKAMLGIAGAAYPHMLKTCLRSLCCAIVASRVGTACRPDLARTRPVDVRGAARRVRHLGRAA